MTQDERNMLQDLANKIAQTPAPPKDQEAEDFIRTKIGSRPDALYIMTQTVLIQNLALQHAQQQIQQLQQQSGAPQVGSGSFLGQNAPPPRSAYSQGPQYSAPQQQYAPPPPQYAPPQQSGGFGGGQTGGFLRGAAQTAAGVAAGGLAFEAINSLFHSGGGGFGGGFGGGGWGGGGFAGAPVEETVVNNYYDEPRDDDRGYNDSGNDDNQQYDDSNYDSGDDGGSFDDNSGDNFS